MLYKINQSEFGQKINSHEKEPFTTSIYNRYLDGHMFYFARGLQKRQRKFGPPNRKVTYLSS